MELAIKSLVNSWFEQHPFIIWILQHPIISLVSLFISIVLLFRLFSAIASLLDKLWIWLLKAPFVLLKFLFGIKPKSTEPTATIINQELLLEPEKISQIMQQLETINQQQQQIIQDIAVLKQKTNHSVVNINEL